MESKLDFLKKTLGALAPVAPTIGELTGKVERMSASVTTLEASSSGVPNIGEVINRVDQNDQKLAEVESAFGEV